MLDYLIRRLLAMIPTLLGITFVTFLIITLAPGDPVATSFGAAGGEEQSTDAGGGQDQDRLADAIRAKKKLLGILEEDRALGLWAVGELTSGAAPVAMELADRMEPLERWPRTIVQRDDGSLLAGDAGGNLYTIDASGEIQHQWAAHDSAITALALSADGRMIISGDGEGVLERWSLTGERLGQTQPLPAAARELLAVPGGDFLSAADDGHIRLHSAANGAEIRRYSDHISRVYALALSADGQTFWSGGYDRKLRQWDLHTGALLQSWEGHGQSINDITLSADGALLATACDDRMVRIFSLPDLADPVVLRGHYKPVTTVLFSPSGDRLYSGGKDETIRVWDLSTHQSIAQSSAATGRVHQLVLREDGALLSAADSWAKVPVWERYLKWLVRIAKLDFDRSFVDDQPVIDKIAKALPVTMGLNGISLLVVYTFSIPLGVMGAVRRNSTFDHLSSLILFTLYSIPSFWLATLLIMMFSSTQNLNILPSVGLHTDTPWDLSFLDWLWDFTKHLIMPVLVMSYAGLASLSRYARTSMLETIGEDYVRTARAKGLDENIVIWKHAFRNSLITIVTLLGNLLPALIGGSVIVEYIFSINGMGRLGFDAILARDYPVIMAITTFSALLTLLGILISDILYSIVDPRVTQK